MQNPFLAGFLACLPLTSFAETSRPQRPNVFQPTTLFNVGVGLGAFSYARADLQFRTHPSHFWSIRAATSFSYYHTLSGSINWKTRPGWQSSGYWLVGAGFVHARVNYPFFGTLSATVPEGHAGWGYEWLTTSKTRHALELRASYPEIASLHYLFGF